MEEFMFNIFRSGMLIIAMTLLMILVGGAVGGRDGAFVFFFISMAFNLFSYLYSDKLVIAMYRAKKADREKYSELYSIIEELSLRAELPKTPELYIVPMDVPNAFATGRSPKKAVVAVTEGLINSMRKDEIVAVIAHELGHIKNWDMLIQTIVASMASAIMWMSFIARWGAILGGGGRGSRDNGGIFGLLFVMIIAPLAATLVQLSVSRSREYMADDFSAKLMGSGEPLANALLTLHGQSRFHRNEESITPATAHMFIFPAGIGKGMGKLFSTHPSLEDRLKNLKVSLS